MLTEMNTDTQHNFIDLGWAQSERLNRGLAAWSSPGSAQWVRATGEDVIKRNRYANVEVFVNNRVKLNVPEGHSDYINASHIRLRTTKSNKEKYFIATQVRYFLAFYSEIMFTRCRVQKKKLRVTYGV